MATRFEKTISEIVVCDFVLLVLESYESILPHLIVVSYFSVKQKRSVARRASEEVSLSSIRKGEFRDGQVSESLSTKNMTLAEQMLKRDHNRTGLVQKPSGVC